jgi:outer membrane immunogenic protein
MRGVSRLAAGAAFASLLGQAAMAQAPVYNWTGFYIGVNGGGAWSNNDWTDPLGPLSQGGDRGTGWQFGGQAGFNYQIGMWVVGIEGQIAALRINSEHIDPLDPLDTLRTRIDRMGHVAGRVGVAYDRFMFYVVGGPAWMSGRHEVIDLGINERDARFSRSGWMLGLGAAAAIEPRMRVFIEYNYFDFGTERTTLIDTAPPFAPTLVDIRQDVQVVKLGVNFQFNPLSPP